MNRPPSLLQIIRIDAIAAISICIPLLIWGMDVAWMLLLGATSFENTLHNIAMLLLMLVALGSRAGRISSAYHGGIQIAGKIRSMTQQKILAKIGYSYSYLRREYTGIVDVILPLNTLNLKVGDPVTAMIDPAHPKRSFLRELYIKGEAKRYAYTLFDH